MTATATHNHKESIMHEHTEHEAQNESFTAMVCGAGATLRRDSGAR